MISLFSKSILSARLMELRLKSQVTQTALAEAVGVQRTTITLIERGERAASIAVLVALADYFEVSLDYLTGRSDCPDMLAYKPDGSVVVVEAMAPPTTSDDSPR